MFKAQHQPLVFNLTRNFDDAISMCVLRSLWMLQAISRKLHRKSFMEQAPGLPPKFKIFLLYRTS